MGNYSFETVQLIAEHFGRLNADIETYGACERIAKAQCPRSACHSSFPPRELPRGRAVIRQGDGEP